MHTDTKIDAKDLATRTRVLNFLRKTLMMNPTGEALLCRWVQNQTVRSWRSRFVPNHYQYPQASYRQVRRNSVLYNLDISEMHDWYVFFGFQEMTCHYLDLLVEPGAVCLDIGANMGLTTFSMAQNVGAKGQIHAFEPHPGNFRRLKANLELNNLRHVFVHPLALGDTTGTVQMVQRDPRNHGCNQIQEGAVDGSSVQLTTLDRWVQEQGITRIDFIKMDVEGFETRVLKGAQQTLRRWQPTIYAEVNDQHLREQGSSALELLQTLRALGYDLHNVQTSAPVDLAASFANCHFDVLAIARSKNN